MKFNIGAKKFAFAALALLSLGAHAAEQEYIVNGNFSDGDGAQQVGWTVSSNAYEFFAMGYAEGAQGTPGVLAQTVLGATGPATLSFQFFSTAGGYQKVYWDGALVSSITGASEYQSYSFTVNATGTDTLQFIGGNQSFSNYLGAVSLLATAPTSNVPEPATYGMLLLGVGMIGVVARRQSRG